MYAADQAAKTATAVTINDRLNKTMEIVSYQCDRLESVLSRVNGTPQKIESAKAGNAPRPIMSMQNTVENLEALTQRLTDLAGGVESIA